MQTVEINEATSHVLRVFRRVPGATHIAKQDHFFVDVDLAVRVDRGWLATNGLDGWSFAEPVEEQSTLSELERLAAAELKLAEIQAEIDDLRTSLAQ